MTNYSELVEANRIKAGKFSRDQIQKSLRLARRDLKTAKKIVSEDPDWGYNIAYNAMLQMARALMFSRGYRPAGEGQHATTIRFAEITLGEEFASVLEFMDRMRRRRNQAVYDIAGLVSAQEALEAMETAESFVNAISQTLET